MTEQRQIIEFPVPANDWQAYVDTFKENLGQEPNPAGPPIAVFTLSNGDELHIIQVGEVNEVRPPDELLFIGVNSPKAVDAIYEAMRPANRLRKPYDIRVVGWNGKPASTTLRIATFKLFSRGSILAAEGGVIHNPPFN